MPLDYPPFSKNLFSKLFSFDESSIYLISHFVNTYFKFILIIFVFYLIIRNSAENLLIQKRIGISRFFL